MPAWGELEDLSLPEVPEDGEVAAAAIEATAAAAAAEEEWLQLPDLDGLLAEIPAIHEAEQAAAAVAAEAARVTAENAAIEAGSDGSDVEISDIFYHDPNTDAIYSNLDDIPDGQ